MVGRRKKAAIESRVGVPGRRLPGGGGRRTWPATCMRGRAREKLKGTKCSLLRGRKGRCNLRLSLSAKTATDGDPGCRIEDEVGGESDGGDEPDGDASGSGAESGGGTLIDISCEGDSDGLGLFFNDSTSDHVSSTISEVGFEVEGLI